MENEYVDMFADVRDNGKGGKEITLDHKVCQFLGLEFGDRVKIMIKKIPKK